MATADIALFGEWLHFAHSNDTTRINYFAELKEFNVKLQSFTEDVNRSVGRCLEMEETDTHVWKQKRCA